jgi:hypothetical protein
VLRILLGIFHTIYFEGTVFTKFAIVFEKKIFQKDITAIEYGGEFSWE